MYNEIMKLHSSLFVNSNVGKLQCIRLDAIMKLTYIKGVV